MRCLAALAALAFTASPIAAAAVERPCLTPAEFTALSSYALPSIITGTAQRCAASLPPGAWLNRNGDRLASRYAQGRAEVWPDAKAAFVKLSATSGGGSDAANLIKSLPDATQQQMLDALISGMVVQQLPPSRCGVVDQMVRVLSPLPPENAAELIALTVGLGAKTGRTNLGMLSICPA